MATDKWLVTSGGDFATAADWSTGMVPGSSDTALLTAAGSYTVTSSQNETVSSLQMVQGVTLAINGGTFQMTSGSGAGSDNGLIQINGNNTLALGGTLAGSGTVQLNTNGYNADLALISAVTTLSGGGKIVMSDAGQNRIYGATAGNVLNNVSDTISGSGQIGIDQTGLNNQAGGVIDATGTAAGLTLDFGAYSATNAGLIEATGPAGMQIQNSVITNTGGTLKASGANVVLSLVSTTITGGTLLTSAGGVIQTYGGYSATISGVTIAAGSTVAINNNSTLDIANTIVNKGTIGINTNGYNDVLQVTSATATLTGGGAVIMSDNATNYIYGATTTTKLVNVNNRISGSGQLGSAQLVIDNQAAGMINSNGVTGMTIDADGFTNEGLIEDTNTGGLFINSTTITNTGTILATGTNTSVNLNGSDIVGGKLTTGATGGIIQTVGGNTAMIDGSTRTGAVTITAGSNVAIQNNSTLGFAGSIVNDGTIQVNSDGYNDVLLINGASATFTGGGHITLSDTGNNYIYGAAGTDKLVNVNNTISGSGQLGSAQLTIDNQAGGVIDATGTNAGLAINATGFTNEGLVEDTGPAGLGISATTVVNSATLAAFGAGATVNLHNNTVVEGGTLESSGGGYLFTGDTSTLDGVSNGVITLTTGSQFDINGNSTLDLLGTMVNDGTIAMNADGYDNDLIINSATVTLTGGGTIAMNDVASNRIYGAVATNLLVNVNTTITGSGQIGAGQGSFDNQALGVIDATGINAGITIFAQAFSNEGLIEATNTAGLGVNTTTILNSGTLLATGAADTINLYNNTVVEGGTLASSGGGYLFTGNTSTLDGTANGAITLTSGSSFDINGNNTLDLVGTMINHGVIVMNGDGYNNDLIANSATVTLTGGGAIAMDDVGSNRIYGALATDVFANVNNTITGSGQIGVGQGTIDNQAAGIIDSTGTSGITLNATYFSNEGLIEATGTGGLTIQTNIVNSGTLAAYGAGNNVNIVNGAAIEGGTLTGSGGGFFETTNDGTLDGATNGALTLTSAAVFNLYNNSALYVGGSIVNQGTIELNTDGFNNDLIINTPTVSLSGGGQLVMSDAANNRIYGAVTADKLVNVNDTISGSGQLGAGQLTLDNKIGGTINATGVSTDLNINLGSSFTNEGLVKASGPAGLLIQNATLTNTGTIAALSDSSVNILSTTTITNYNAGTLTGGTWEAISAGGTHSSTLTLPTGTITTDAARLVISGAGASIVAGGASVLSTITAISGELDIQNGATFADTGKLAVSGTLLASGGSTISLSGGTLTNTGSVLAQTNGKILSASTEVVTNLVAGTLTGGTWAAIGSGATLALGSGTIATDAATLTLSGVGSSIRSAAGNRTLETTLAKINAGAQLNVLGGRGFASTVAAGIKDSGTISFGGGTFGDTSLTILAGGTFQGGGTLASAVTDGGTLLSSAAPSGSGGSLTVTGAISGTGLLSAAASTSLTAAGGFAVGSLSAAGVLTGAGSVTGAASVSGTLALGATGTLTAGSVSALPGGTVSGASVTASGAIADSGVISLSGGLLSGSTITVGAAAAHLNGYGTVAQTVANTGTIEATGGTLTLSAGESGGTVQADAGGTLTAGAAVSASRLVIAAGGAFIGAGTISGATSDSGTLTASGGSLTLASVSGTGSAVIASGATLQSTTALALAGVSFAGGGSSEVLALGTPAGDTAVISGFASGTTIDLLNTTVTNYSYVPATGVLTLKNGTATSGTLKFAGSYTRASFALSSDGHGGVDITFTGTPMMAMDDLHSAVAATSGAAADAMQPAPASAGTWDARASTVGMSFDPVRVSMHGMDAIHLSVQ